MGTATKTLIVIISAIAAKLGDEDGKFGAAIAEVQEAEAAEEAEIQSLKEQIAALPAPFDPSALEADIQSLKDAAGAGVSGAPLDLTALTDRVQALEDRNEDDDAAANAALPAGSLGGLPDGTGVTALAIDDTPLAELVLGAAYAAQVLASGGVSPYQFSMLSGSLPDGLSMAAGGAITGTPTTVGVSLFAVQVHDANGAMASGSFTLAVDIPADHSGA